MIVLHHICRGLHDCHVTSCDFSVTSHVCTDVPPDARTGHAAAVQPTEHAGHVAGAARHAAAATDCPWPLRELYGVQLQLIHM